VERPEFYLGVPAMTPQSHFMVLATIAEDRIGALEQLLLDMNRPDAPGMAEPKNALVPFGDFDTVHYARFVILKDETLEDFVELGEPVPQYPIRLAFFGDVDGPGDDFLASLARHQTAAAGLRRIFEHCEDFAADTDLLTWMRRYSQRPAAAYVNWIGRTVRQVRQEAKLRGALVDELIDYLGKNPKADDNARGLYDHLLHFVDAHPELKPSPPEPTPGDWYVRNALHFAIIPALLLLPWLLAIPCLVPPPRLFFWVVVPFLVIGVIVFVWLTSRAVASFAFIAMLALWLVPFFILFPKLLVPVAAVVVLFLLILRWYEKNEREVIPRPTRAHDSKLAALEDHDVTNQFTVIGSVKPSLFRRWMAVIILWLIDYGARHVYNRGFLARIQSIHFARWVFLDNKRRLLFASNYDGSRQAYMDDFINKVGWGLNLAFGSGVGYPRCNWLVRDGAKNELRFKDTNRRHQIATQVWYRGYPGLTAFDLARNTRVRQGLERTTMSDAEIRAWLRDL
jgi:hypothetical protein